MSKPKWFQLVSILLKGDWAQGRGEKSLQTSTKSQKQTCPVEADGAKGDAALQVGKQLCYRASVCSEKLGGAQKHWQRWAPCWLVCKQV